MALAYIYSNTDISILLMVAVITVFVIGAFSISKTHLSGGCLMWCRGKDSNLRRRMPTDLQSVVFDRFTTSAKFGAEDRI